MADEFTIDKEQLIKTAKEEGVNFAMGLADNFFALLISPIKPAWDTVKRICKFASSFIKGPAVDKVQQEISKADNYVDQQSEALKTTLANKLGVETPAQIAAKEKAKAEAAEAKLAEQTGKPTDVATNGAPGNITAKQAAATGKQPG